VRAEARYLVRFGEPTYAERVLDVLAAIGYDAYGIAVMGSPAPCPTTAVIEVVDRSDGQTVWRARDDVDAIYAEHDRITAELRAQDQGAFAAEWDLREPMNRRR
jgi:hypothetical protein